MEINLNLTDVYFILESLEWTKKAFQEYPIASSLTKGRGYPDWNFKKERIKEANDVIKKMRKIRNELKKER